MNNWRSSASRSVSVISLSTAFCRSSRRMTLRSGWLSMGTVIIVTAAAGRFVELESLLETWPRSTTPDRVDFYHHCHSALTSGPRLLGPCQFDPHASDFRVVTLRPAINLKATNRH